MLEFVKFRVTNAGPFKKFDLDLKKRGLVRMCGKNGGGKSSVGHLLTQVGYSTNPNKTKVSELQYDTEEPSDFLLELTFIKNGSTYVAAQAHKSKTKSPEGKNYATGSYLFRDGADISMHKDPDTKNLIKQTLGWSLDEWFGYVYLAQSTTHKLIEGTRSDRQTYLSALFNLSPLDLLASYCSEKARTLADQIEGLEKEKTEYNLKFTLLNGRNSAELKQKVEEIDREIEGLNDRQSKLQAAQEKFNRKSLIVSQLSEFPDMREVDEINAEIEATQKKNQEYWSNAKLREAFEAQLSKLQEIPEQIIPDNFESALSYPDIDPQAAKTELERLKKIEREQAIKQKPEKPEIPGDFDSVLSAPSCNVELVQKKIRAIETRPEAPATERTSIEVLHAQRDKVQTLSTDVAVVKAAIVPLQFSAPECDKCGSVLNCEDREAKLAEKETELESLETLLIKAKKKLKLLEEADQEWRSYDALGPDLSEELPDLKRSLEIHSKKEHYLKLKALQDTFDKFQVEEREALAQIAKIPDLSQSISRYEHKQEAKRILELVEKRKAYLTEKAQIEERLSEIPSDGMDLTERLSSLSDEIEEAKKKAALEEEVLSLKSASDQTKKLDGLKDILSEQQTARGALLQEIKEVDQLSASIQLLQESISSKEHLYSQHKMYSILAKGYGKAGQLRERQLSKFSQYLESSLLSHTIRQLPEHRFKIVVDDGIDILASKNNGKLYDVKAMSGGEKGALSVAFLFALDDLLPPDRRSSIKILDEIESGFDSERQQDFVQYTLPELKKRADTVVVISHLPISHQVFDVIWNVENGKIQEHLPEDRQFEELTLEE